MYYGARAEKEEILLTIYSRLDVSREREREREKDRGQKRRLVSLAEDEYRSDYFSIIGTSHPIHSHKLTSFAQIAQYLKYLKNVYSAHMYYL
jgi:hypothetical protein